MKVLVVAGARPNFMKVAPILRALEAAGHETVLVHTGQHYDTAMSDTFFEELGIKTPDYHLGVGTATHAVQTARIMEAFEPILMKVHPQWVVVVGDVNSTMATTLVASKLRTETHAHIAHVEAGLRSYDWRMPEEINRVITDRLADLLLTPSEDAAANLAAEGIPADKVTFVGNVMIDTLMLQLPVARATDTLERLGLRRRHYVAATLHRPSNVDDPAALAAVLDGLALVAESLPVVLPLHPRTLKNIERFHLGPMLTPLTVLEPLGYTQMLALTDGAQCVLTDSGGIQEETTALGIPCVTLREQTERPITITQGTNHMAPWPLTPRGILGAYADSVAAVAHATPPRPVGWDGHASERIVKALETHRPVRNYSAS
ncbi:MAG TPA: UDP-N-acetylglucosamine 2-epimerase (non-hydrolyzing) [Gemmatimonadaceae bacterium]